MSQNKPMRTLPTFSRRETVIKQSLNSFDHSLQDRNKPYKPEPGKHKTLVNLFR